MTPIKSNLKLIVKVLLVYLGNCGRRWWEVNDENVFIKFVDEC